ncbi:MAG: hypothetical protein P8105_05715 [Dehalococcoidia bacterium]
MRSWKLPVSLKATIDGKFPEAKADCLAIIDSYLSLPDDERLNYRLGRRGGYYEGLRDMKNERKHQQIAKNILDIRNSGEDVEDVIYRLKRPF